MWAAGAGAVLCLIYYAVIVFYSGFSTSFSWIWPAAALFLLALTGGGIYNRLHPRRCPLWVPVSALTFLGASLMILCVTEVFVFLGALSGDVSGLDYVIVLGAKVENGRISNSLEKRLQKAIEYAERNPETILILSGGQGSDEPGTEAQGMYDYLVGRGIAPQRIIKEEASRNTYENILFSGQLFDMEEAEVGIVTSNFHVFRALRLARAAGYQNVCGIAARSHFGVLPNNMLREFFGILKDFVVGNLSIL